MVYSSLFTALVSVALLVGVNAETHTVTFVNKCVYTALYLRSSLLTEVDDQLWLRNGNIID